MNVRRYLWVALCVALGVMLLMAYLQRRRPQPASATSQPATQKATRPATRPAAPPASQAARTSEPAPAATRAARVATSAATAPAAQATWRNDTFAEHERSLGSLDPKGDYTCQVQLTSRGAAIRTVKLAEYFMTVRDKRRYHKEPKTYDQAVEKDPKLEGHYSLLNAVGVGEEKTYPLATRRIRFPQEQGVALDLSGLRWRAGEVATDEQGTQSVTFTSEVFRDGEPFVRIEKTYSLPRKSYSVKVALAVRNLTDRKVSFVLTQFGPTGVTREDYRQDKRALAFAGYVKGELKVGKTPIGKVQKAEPGLKGAAILGRSDTADAVLWIGQTNNYFAALTYIVPKEGEALAAPSAKAEFFAGVASETPELRTHLAGMRLGEHEVEAGKDVEVQLDLFVGPKRRELFDDTPLYAALHYKETLDFGSCCPWCTFTWLSLAVIRLLNILSTVAFGNYGLAIIILIIIVQILMFPLNRKAAISMERMKKLQPEVAKLREKYKDDKAKLNEEMMGLYKSQGSTPMLGCLPMFLQMPIWIALWTGIQAAVELRHAAFLPVWITDLAAPDALVSFGGKALVLPCIGSMIGPIGGFNLLPLLWAVGMVLHSKLTPTAPTGDQQARTQKNMMMMMTVFFPLLLYNAPSGLTLYLSVSGFLRLGEQYLIRKHMREREETEAAVETRVSMPGKRFRGQKPKKPKGPFRFTK